MTARDNALIVIPGFRPELGTRCVSALPLNMALIVRLQTAVVAGENVGGWWLSLSEAPVHCCWGFA
ncbi:MAG: hypothetical protein NTY19_24925 [Planctomycetota bacterium]|nr:hypothetical protein [Planctomycetota bacterium]